MKKLALLVLVVGSLALVACGGDDDSDTNGGGGAATTTEEGGNEGGTAGGGANEGGANGGGGTLTISAADTGLAYSSETASTEAGKVTVEFDNPQPLDHDVAFEDDAGKTVGRTEIIADGSTSAVVEFEPGSYQFYCTVPGHREGGMEGTLTVE